MGWWKSSARGHDLGINITVQAARRFVLSGADLFDALIAGIGAFYR
jgi:hypothetical protein